MGEYLIDGLSRNYYAKEMERWEKIMDENYDAYTKSSQVISNIDNSVNVFSKCSSLSSSVKPNGYPFGNGQFYYDAEEIKSYRSIFSKISQETHTMYKLAKENYKSAKSEFDKFPPPPPKYMSNFTHNNVARKKDVIN